MLQRLYFFSVLKTTTDLNFSKKTHAQIDRDKKKMFEITTRPPNTFVFNNSHTSSPYHHNQQQHFHSPQHHPHPHHIHVETSDAVRLNRRNQTAHLNSSSNNVNKQRSSSISIPSRSLTSNTASNSSTINSTMAAATTNQAPTTSASLAYAYYNRHNLNRIPITASNYGTSGTTRPSIASTSYFKAYTFL